MLCAILWDIAFAVRIVMSDASQVAEQFAGSDWPLFLREGRAILLDFGIELELSAFR
jgi:hypothetical protein